MGDDSRPSRVDDRLARAVFTPLFGLLVPNLAGIIDHSSHSTIGLVGSYAWFIGIAFATWQGNLFLYFRFQDRTAWLTRPWHRVRLLVGLICLFTIPVTAAALWSWARVTGDPAATGRSLGVAVLIIVAVVIFVTDVYETVFLVRDWESDRLRNERLQRENLEAELDTLRSEVNPHTLFNNLNVLSHLVEQGSPRAQAFIRALAASHRHLLQVGSQRLVPLAEELSLLDHFVTLVGIRYGGGLRVSTAVDVAAAERWLIPPGVLPELLQNAVKHNEIARECPVEVIIRLDGDRVLVSNNTRPRARRDASTGVGLRNLARRFRLLAGTPARWGEVGGQFVVTLPLVPADAPVPGSAADVGTAPPAPAGAVEMPAGAASLSRPFVPTPPSGSVPD
jgi:two-component sensor histidine kinase